MTQAICTTTYISVWSFLAASRPGVEQMFYFLEAEKGWILDKLFGGVSPDFVAQSLASKSSLTKTSHYGRRMADFLASKSSLPKTVLYGRKWLSSYCNARE